MRNWNVDITILVQLRHYLYSAFLSNWQATGSLLLTLHNCLLALYTYIEKRTHCFLCNPSLSFFFFDFTIEPILYFHVKFWNVTTSYTPFLRKDLFFSLTELIFEQFPTTDSKVEFVLFSIFWFLVVLATGDIVNGCIIILVFLQF